MRYWSLSFVSNRAFSIAPSELLLRAARSCSYSRSRSTSTSISACRETSSSGSSIQDDGASPPARTLYSSPAVMPCSPRLPNATTGHTRRLILPGLGLRDPFQGANRDEHGYGSKQWNEFADHRRHDCLTTVAAQAHPLSWNTMHL